MSVSLEELKSRIETEFPKIRLKKVRESFLLENPEDLSRVAHFLKDDTDLSFDYLSSVTGADYLDYLECVYHFYSMKKKTGPFVLRVRTPRGDPEIPSLVSIYRGAEFQEREAYDMYGFIFQGHPDLKRIFMWDGFEGFPMRKDYEQEDSEVLEAADIEALERRGVCVPEAMKKKAEELAREGRRAIAPKPTDTTGT